MAKKVTVTLTDDLDPKLAADETVSLSLDGVDYEIDLSSANADKLRAKLAPWVEKARRVSGKGKATRKRSSLSRDQSQAIREWASRAGHKVSARGRIPGEVVEAFKAAN